MKGKGISRQEQKVKFVLLFNILKQNLGIKIEQIPKISNFSFQKNC